VALRTLRPGRASAPALARNAEMAQLHQVFFVAAVATVLVIRTQLWLTHYPQLGGAGLHIAHLLWGGLFMTIAIGLLVSYLGSAARRVGAVIGGVGFGFFIDELGKFITADNNYFFRPAAALIYLIFVGLFLLTRRLERLRPLVPAERVANATLLAGDAAMGRLDAAGRARALALLDGARDEPLAAPLREMLHGVDVAPSTGPGRLRRLAEAVERAYLALVSWRGFATVLIAIFALWAALSVVAVVALVLSPFGIDLGEAAPRFVSDEISELSFVNVASVVSSLVSAAFVAVAIAHLRAHRRLVAYAWLERAVLVSIFVTQTFSFVESQFGAVFGLGIALLLLVSVRELIALEARSVARTGARDLPPAVAAGVVAPAATGAARR
jgi:hypothetical protein